MTASPYGETASPLELEGDAASPEPPDVIAMADEYERRVAAKAGTPLSELASDDEDDDDGLEQLNAHVRLEDGQAWDVLVVNRDFVAWDLTRGKKKWPSAEDAPFLLNTFLAHAASRRAGHYAGNLDAFSNDAAVVKVTRAAKVRPTSAGAGPASS